METIEKQKEKVEIRDISEAPVLERLKKMFNVDEQFLIVAYGDVIYVKSGKLSADLLIHELVHCERQNFSKVDAMNWWEKYFSDPDFRLNEEILAYKEQYKYCQRVFKDKNKRFAILNAMAKQLSSEMYGKIVSYNQALKLIGFLS